MATPYYVDTSRPDDTGAGTSWAVAEKTFAAGLVDAIAGDSLFAQDVGDTGLSTLTSAGTKGAPVQIWGVKNTTVAEPPTDSDLSVLGVDTLYKLAATTSFTNLLGFAVVHSIELETDATGDIIVSGGWDFLNCRLDWGDDLRVSGASGLARFWNCEFDMTANANFDLQSGGTAEAYHCAIVGTPDRIIQSASVDGHLLMVGCDLSVGLTGDTLVTLTGANSSSFRFIGCKLPATVTLTAGDPDDRASYAEFIGCSSATGLGSSNSVPDYYKKSLAGIVESETTKVLTGGATDLANGAFSYKVTTSTNNIAPLYGVELQTFAVWLEGDGTQQTLEVYFTQDSTNDSSTPVDKSSDHLHMELFAAGEDGTPQYALTYDDKHTTIPSNTTLTDDTGSSWPAGTSNDQKLVVKPSPDYQGWAIGVVRCTESHASNIYYVDPKMVVL